MEINLLGPLIVRFGGRDVDINSAQAKGLLTVLVVAPNQRMRQRDILPKLWPVERAVALRRVVEATRNLNKRMPKPIARNENLQCMIETGEWKIDYLHFMTGITDAKRMEGRDRLKRLQESLDEWSGDPLIDADLAKFDLSAERAILDDRRCGATLDLLGAMVECGELTAFRLAVHDAVQRWPHDVRLLTLACDFFADNDSENHARAFLAKHLSKHHDPNGDLSGLQDRFGPPAAIELTGTTVPRQLPRNGRPFVGRQRETQILTEILMDASPRATRFVTVAGMAGVGKTELVRAVGHELQDRFPGGTLHVDLHGFGAVEPEKPEQMLTMMLGELGVEPAVRTLDGLISAFRTATAGRPLLVVLDNARDSAQARPLLPGKGCAVVVASRIRLESLIHREGAYPLTVRPFERPEAIDMLADSLGEDRMRQAGHLAGEIAELVGGLPLALAVVAARVANSPAEAVRKIRDALRETKTRLDALSYEDDGKDKDLDVRVALSYSYAGLSEAAADLWALLALHPGPTISLAAAADLAGRDCESDVKTLIAGHLLEEQIHQRYAMHDLVRDYGLELADRLPPGRAERAGTTAFDFLLHHVWACDRALVPGRELPIPPPAPDSAEARQTREEAMAWLDDEYPTITAALRAAANSGADRYTWLLAMALLTYQWRRSKFADAEHYLRAAAEAAERVASLLDQATVYRMLAGSRWNMKKYELARGAQIRAVALSEQVGDVRGVGYGYVGLGALHLDQHEYAQAGTEYGKALVVFRRLSDDLGEADALSGLARVALAEGDQDRALQECAGAGDLYERTGDVNGQASVLVLLGEVYEARGDVSRAAATYDLAISHYRSMTRHSHEARTLVLLAGVLRLDGRDIESGQALRRALTLYRDLSDEDGLAHVEALLAQT